MMEHGAGHETSALDVVPIVIDGLRKPSDPNEPKDEETNNEKTHAERILLSKNEPLSALWEKVQGEYDPTCSARRDSCFAGLMNVSSWLSTSTFTAA